MNYEIDGTSRIPAYIQLYQMLRSDIIAGVYSYGSKLPSKRTMAEETGVSVITIEHTVELLCEEGYTEARPRSGVYVIFKKSDFQGMPAVIGMEHSLTGQWMEAAGKSWETEPMFDDRSGSGGSSALNFPPKSAHASVSAFSYGTSAAKVHGHIHVHSDSEFPYTVLAKTMRRVLLDYGERILVKSPNDGCAELRSEISAYMARSRSIHVKPDQIIIGSGAEYLYSLVAQMFGKETVFALEDPSYGKIRQVYEAYGIRCDMLPLKPDGIASEDLRKTRATVLHITPFNSYPTGISVGGTKKQEYLGWAAQRGGILIEDNYDSELTISGRAENSLFSMTEQENVIYMNTFSRTIAPSIRVGYMILPERLIEIFHRRLGFYSCTVPAYDQYVLAELLRSGDFERHINRVRRRKRKEKKTENFTKR